MSAAEVIELIKKLPPADRAEVAAYLQAAETPAVHVAEAATERKATYVSDEEFDKVLPQVFEKHHELFRRLAQ